MRSEHHPLLRAAVVGYGAYGRLHAQKYLEHEDTRLVAIADSDPERLRAARAEHPNVSTFRDPADLAGYADIASVVVPATGHYSVARRLVDGGIHLLVEKPFTASSAEARALAAAASAQKCILQPGYLERFNFTFRELRVHLANPRYIEARRLTQWRGRGTDVNVIMDLMIHDIDMLLEMIRAPVIEIRACGVRVFSDHWDVANAQLHFANGCVANLTASRASPVPDRRLHAFSDDACALADIENGILLLHQRYDDMSDVVTQRRCCRQEDPLAAEIDAFVCSVQNGRGPIVNAMDGCRALKVAERINAAMKPDVDVVTRTAAPLINSERAIAYLLRHRQHGPC